MKNKIKKNIAALLAICMAGFCFTGCSEKESDVCEITYYALNDVFPDDAEVIEKANEYLVDKIGVKVNWITIPSAEYEEKMRMTFASGEEWDVCFTSSDKGFYSNVDNGVFMPLDELLKEQGKDIYEITPDYFFDAAKVDGEIYALPFLKDVAEEWVINTKNWLVEKYNLDTSGIKSLADLTPLLQTIRDNEPQIVPILMRGNNTLFRFLGNEDIPGCSVGSFVDGNYDEIVNQYKTEEAKEFFRLMRDWYTKGFIRTDAATVTNDSDLHATGNYFALYSGYLPYSEIMTNPDKTTWTTPIHGLNEPHLRTGNVLGCAFAISSSSKNPEKAMEFLNIMNTDKYLRNLITLGIEGKHWVADGETHWKLPEGVATKKETGYAPYEWQMGNRFLMRIEKGKPADMWEKFEEFNNNSTISPALGFVFNPNNVANEIAAIENVYQEYAPAIMVGAVDPDEILPKFLEKLDKAGADKVLEEMNRQYSAWKNNK